METRTIGGKREKLADKLPLEAPYLVQIFPVYGCNFKCEFCIFSKPKKEHKFMSDCVMMDMEVYEKAILNLKKLPQKIKMLRFAGTGEPLLHKNIAQMIKIAKDNDVAERIDIVTNGALLNEKLSNDLIEAGLDTLRISLNGLNDYDFLNRCEAKVDYKEYVKQVEYFYQNRKNTTLYIKIIDYMVEDEKIKKEFYETFEPICDTINIEHLTETVDIVDIEKVKTENSFKNAQGGDDLLDIKICPQPFYIMQINPDGNIVPCCSMEYPIILGNVSDEDVNEIWINDKFNKFRRNLLELKLNSVCSKCNLYKYGTYKEDILDYDTPKLLNLF